MTTHPSERIKLGISQCLLGEPVRYDGDHKRDQYLVDVLGDYVNWVSVCPEFEAGFGVPRPPIRLVNTTKGVRVWNPQDQDVTQPLQAACDQRIETLKTAEVCGFVLKKNSPSCGLSAVPREDGTSIRRDGVGLFAATLAHHFPNLPCEDEARLEASTVRQNFIGRIYAYDRWQRCRRSPEWPASFANFHARHALLLRAHDPERCTALTRRVSEANPQALEMMAETYEMEMMSILSRPVSRERHGEILGQVLVLVRPRLEHREFEDARAVIARYTLGGIPWRTPAEALRPHLRDEDTAERGPRLYLNPCPVDLAQRSGF